jgi:hypothetical protein
MGTLAYTAYQMDLGIDQADGGNLGEAYENNGQSKSKALLRTL